ncbi:hypothetical protein IFM89_036462 [Coptis chinensis]|uniref:Uncharacterized protein n=1 Tax=Coptis chinensis TaxID=261450 RepID=A0A835J072_9MAGN|nr:hypothetical protein IFM89_036462 [Coptis chinensis]
MQVRSKIWSGSYSRVKKHFLGEGGFGVKECNCDPQTLKKIFKSEHENALKHKAMSNAAKSASVPLPQVHDGTEPPHVDREVSINREEYFRRLFPNDAQRIVARSEFGKFSAGLGDYGKWEVMTQRSSENPLVWWSTNGSSTPLRRKLWQPASFPAIFIFVFERNWSTFSHIHTLKRIAGWIRKEWIA